MAQGRFGPRTTRAEIKTALILRLPSNYVVLAKNMMRITTHTCALGTSAIDTYWDLVKLRTNTVRQA
jgi:hypothetical protein